MQITRKKKDALRRSYIDGSRNEKVLARKMGLQEATVLFYFKKFEQIEQERPDKLVDFDFYFNKEGVAKATVRYQNLHRVLPELLAAEKGLVIIARHLYRRYQLRFPGEYSEPRFFSLFKNWFDAHEQEICAKRLAEKFTKEELNTLQQWRRGNDRRLWQVAVTLMTVYTYR